MSIYRRFGSRILMVVAILQLVFTSFSIPFFQQENYRVEAASQYQLEDNWTVSPGVNYQEETFNEGSLEESVRMMEIDLNDPYTTIEMGMPQPFPSLETVSSQARKNSRDEHRVVGAVNASFYHTTNRLPAYLISMNQSLYNLGAISASSGGYMSVPTAFGMTNDGKAVLGKYDLDIRFLHSDGVVRVNSINKERQSGEIILYTPSYRFDYTRTNEFGIEITVSGASKSLDTDDLKFGDIISGKVTNIRRYGDKTPSTIPDDGFVLSIHGGELANQFKYTSKGDNIHLKINIDDKWKETQFMLASGPMLVENGNVDLAIDKDSYRASERHPRTAIGTNEDGSKVYFITVDGRQSGYSDGMNLTEFAEYIQSKGIHTAINLDGGGSTTMVAREYGNLYPTVVNKPSSGFERAVSTTLQAISTAPVGQPTHLGAHKLQEGKVVKGSRLEVASDYILDQYYHPLELDQEKVSYTVDSLIGHMEENMFVADRAGTGHIVARYAGTTTKIPVEVVDKVDQLEITPSNFKIGEGSAQQFSVEAFSQDGSSLVFDESTVDWSVEGNIGTINQQGRLNAVNAQASGAVKVTLNGQSFSTKVEVGGTRQVLDSFSDASLWNLETARAKGHFRVSQGIEPVAVGDTSLRFGYNFATGEAGTAATYLVRKKPLAINGRPQHLGMWVYGDENAHWLRGKLIDGSGQTFTLDFTKVNELNWNGWKYVKADIPEDAKLPLTFDRIYIAEADETKKDSGVLFLDKLVASYQVEEDVIDNLVTYDIVDQNKEWEVTFNTELMASSINQETVYVLDKTGQKFNVDVRLDESQKIVRVKPKTPYSGDQFYRLVISENIRAVAGREMGEEVSKVFKVEK